jgi:DNA-binding CsgD family transcriptional regulator
MQSTKVFVSYSHDNKAHKEWVLKLSTDLALNGVDVVLDQWNLRAGQNITSFMHKGIASSDRVLMICSKKYVERANNGVGGVGYENLIVSAEIAAQTETLKYVPLIRGNDSAQKIPTFMGNRLYIDFENDDDYDEKFNECLNELLGVTRKITPKSTAQPAQPSEIGELYTSATAMYNKILLLSPSAAKSDRLTAREIDVLRLARTGKTGWEIASILGISQATSTFHMKNAIDKLGASNKTHAVILAVEQGLIE